MKKIIITTMLMLALVFSINNGLAVVAEANSETITYQSENGPVEVPANPERIIVLSSFAGNVLALDGNLVGVDPWAKKNPLYNLDGVEAVTSDNLEKIIELKPDLIIGLSSTSNINRLKMIAPTITYTYGRLGYLEQHLEIGKLLNKEEEARTWINDFRKKARSVGEKIREKIGEDATVTVIENYNKMLYVFGDNWARGTEILYQEMKLKMPKRVKELALKPGYSAISFEVLPEVAGDYIIFSKNSGADTSFQETETYRNIPAVQNDRVFEVNAEKFYFNDPITLEFQLDFFKEKFLNN
ncbi:ABC-type Fe3+-hydroxamate transport system, periplasmic component [Halobacteroides halobius DSM 5150]|uniref:ABC-type Fe3+-hydroxamate transport system, periplasmic component n=1 Tax=Halobacteroides halobius (strain ATCC 35273 / DSM 5150 / MD-1) TaxID=748449 RepID=L0K7Q6_HALHC|nr:iron-hydroxamate ABC transporter substrate-binding protein [Halobacteroides halobius]AGB40585.1 ABC-type Fe3+-hydroxamate transport system, periplasmic component [Halobacteroides halobius DSM 5150]